MRFDWALCLFTLLTAAAAAGIEPRRLVERIDSSAQSDEHELYRRRGGGGGGGRGGGGGGGSRTGGGGGSSRGGGGSSSPPANARPNSNAGGTSRAGSGPQPAYGGGRFYGGGARQPYRAGGTSRAGLAPIALLGVGALAFWPGIWLTSAYMYNYPHHYRYYNSTTDEDEEKPVMCGCAEEEVCGCDENNSTLKELIGNGSYAALNKSVVNVGTENGTDYILVNGTLPKGTTLKDEDADEQTDDEDAGAGLRNLLEALGFWPAVVAVVCTVWLV